MEMSDANAIFDHLMQTGQEWDQPDQQPEQQGRRGRRRRRGRGRRQQPRVEPDAGCICGFNGICDVCELLVDN